MDVYQYIDNIYHPVSRECYDAVEKTCQGRYCLLIEMTDGTQFAALALMIRRNRLGEEFLCVGIAEEVREVRLDRIHAVTVLEASLKLKRIELVARKNDFDKMKA